MYTLQAIASESRSFSASSRSFYTYERSLSSAALVSFCHDLQHVKHIIIFCMTPLEASKGCVQGNAVYAALNEGLGVFYDLVDHFLVHRIKLLGVQHYPVVRCSNYS